jgi:hypothetical protein
VKIILNPNNYDLFNPIITKEISMTHKLGELENPYIQVVWEDDSSNFSRKGLKVSRNTSKRNILLRMSILSLS